jgi:hypothetical protein
LLLLVVFPLPALAHERPVPSLSIDAGAVAIAWPKGTEAGHGPNVPKGVVANYGTDTEDVPATFSIYDSTGDLVYSASVTETLAPSQSETCCFPTWTAISGNNYMARLQTTLAGDQNPANDTLSQVFSVLSGSRDVGVDSICKPTFMMDTTDFAPSAGVQNYGDLPESFYTYMRITYLGNSRMVYYDSFPVANIAAHTAQQVTFRTWTGHKIYGQYEALAWSLLSADQIPSNDSQFVYFVIMTPERVVEWRKEADVPHGPKGKGVGDGAQLTYTANAAGDSQLVWCLKGNNTNEFYCYQVDDDSGVWQALESIPLVSQQVGKARRVKKGSVLVAGTNGMIYAAKGGGSDEWWQYDPAPDTGKPVWIEKAMVPSGTRALDQGAGAVAVSNDGHSYVYLLKGSETTEFYRYDCGANTWAPMAAAPLGPSGKPFRDGSCLAYEPNLNLIYCLKGHYDEFFAYSVDGDTWLNPLPMLPVIGLTGKPKEAKSGAAMAGMEGFIYALKGGNTYEFFQYDEVDGSWSWNPNWQYPVGDGRKVGPGGTLTFAPKVEDGTGGLFSTKGNNTTEFYEYAAFPWSASAPHLCDNADASETAPIAAQLSVAPNPFSGSTRISYTVPKVSPVSIRLYDATGRLVRTVKEGYCNAGRTSALVLDASHLAQGIYLLKFNSEGYSSIQKLVLE